MRFGYLAVLRVSGWRALGHAIAASTAWRILGDVSWPG
jgi:hypothetical protein